MTQPSTSPPSTAATLREACADLLRRLWRGEAARAESYLESHPALAADAMDQHAASAVPMATASQKCSMNLWTLRIAR